MSFPVSSVDFPFPTPTAYWGLPTEVPAPPSTSSGGSSTNSLYLFTFLTTLLLLLGISCGIIFRAFILRRRYRARIQQAIDAGILLQDGSWPAPSGGHQASKLGAKPVLWDVSMYGERPKAAFDGYDNEKGDFQWKDLMPVSAAFTHTVQPKQSLEPHTLPAPVTQSNSRPLTGPRRLLRGLFQPQTEDRSRDPTLDDPSSPSQPTATIPSLPTSPMELQKMDSEPDKLQVSFLIAMPNPSKPQYQPRGRSASPTAVAIHLDSEDETKPKGKAKSLVVAEEDVEMELPDIVFGVTEMKWKYGKMAEDGDAAATEGTEQNTNAGGGTVSSSAH